MEKISEAAEQGAPNQRSATPPDEITALDRHYGAIGISAVAAAARYWSAGKNPAAVPASPK